MTTYTKKYVNGVLINLTPTDQTVIAARDAANWGTTGPGTVVVLTPAQKVARLARAYGLTVAELKTTLGI